MIRSRVWVSLFVISTSVCGCALLGRSEPRERQARELTVHVQNQNFYDATLHAIGPGGSRHRLGRVPGNSEDTFTFRWTFLGLRIEISLLSVGATLTDELPVDEGDELELIVTADLHRRIP